MKSTVFLLMAEFDGQSQIKLDDLCEKYLGLNITSAKRLASNHTLPFPAYRCGTQSSPWLVNINDLAEFLDLMRDESKELWQKMKV